MTEIARHKLIEKVKVLLEEEGPLPARRIASRLAQRGDLYVVMDGEREAVSTYAMKRQLNLSTEVVENEEGDWEVSSFWARKPERREESSSQTTT